jgi:hypothetical protein
MAYAVLRKILCDTLLAEAIVVATFSDLEGVTVNN